GLDLPFELLVGGGDDTDIDLDRALAADGGDEPLLQDAEDLRLRGRTHIADLVEEEGPAVGELELPGPVGEGPREGPLHMPEEFALDELRGDRRAVDLDEGAVGARRESVDGTGDEFLAGAVLPGDQDPRVGWADDLDPIEEGPDRVTAPHYLVAALDLVPETGVLLGEPALLECVAD